MRDLDQVIRIAAGVNLAPDVRVPLVRATMGVMERRNQSAGEEIANSVSHGLALLATIAAVVLLIPAIRNAGTVGAIGISIFATTMVLLYLTSTLYHALPAGRGKRIVNKLDHGAIFVFIAGSYTPFALGAPSGALDWAPIALVWLVAIAGVWMKAADRIKHPWASTAIYVVVGWTVLAAALPLLGSMPAQGVELLVAGGLAYTLGVVFFLCDARMHYAHAVWHCFVVTGTAFHFFAVLGIAG
jgi:hemolysin III